MLKIKWCSQDKIWMVGYDKAGCGWITMEEFETFQEAWKYKKNYMKRKD